MQLGEDKKDLDDSRQSGKDNLALDATQELILHVMQQLNFTTREIIFHVTLKAKAKHGEHKPNLDPTLDLIFDMYCWILSKE